MSDAKLHFFDQETVVTESSAHQRTAERLNAGSDRMQQGGCNDCRRTPPGFAPTAAVAGPPRPSIWDNDCGERLPTLREAFRDANSGGQNSQGQNVCLGEQQDQQPRCRQAQSPRSPGSNLGGSSPARSQQAACSQPPRCPRHDESSHTPTPQLNRSFRSRSSEHPTSPRPNRSTSNPSSRRASSENSQSQPSCPSPRRNSRRDTYDVLPQQQQGPRCDNNNVPPQQQQSLRRETYDVPPQQQHNLRRDTYDVPPQQQHSLRRDTYDVPSRGGERQYEQQQQSGSDGPRAFTLVGNISVDLSGQYGRCEFASESEQQQQPWFSQEPSGQNIHDFFDNYRPDMVAPRSLATPGCPYVRFDADVPNVTPEMMREIIANRSSLPSQPRTLDELPDLCATMYHSTDESSADQWPPQGLADPFMLISPADSGRRPSRNGSVCSNRQGSVSSRPSC